MLAIFGAGMSVIEAAAPARAMTFGGALLDGERVWWNFVSSSKERIERAKDDWKRGRFKKVVGDEVDFVPLPEY
jgi:redox-sensitive bicupin YhaK (pirin superfamily)